MKVICLVDNTVKESTAFWGEHGLAFLIETDQGCVLFDAGQSGAVLLHNLQAAKIEPTSICAVALSHAHYDHSGGLYAVLQQTGQIPLYAHPDLFRERFSRRETKVEKIGPAMDRTELLNRASLRLSDKPQEILPGVYTTGEIVARPELEGRSVYHLVHQNGGWIADPYRDDMSIVLKTTQGLVLICGCCHAGLLNTLQHVQATFRGDITAVVGGMHLINMNEAQIHHVVQALRSYGAPQLYPNHCTGPRAYVALSIAFGARVNPCPAGTELNF